MKESAPPDYDLTQIYHELYSKVGRGKIAVNDMSFTDEFRELGFKTNIDTYCDLVLLIHCQRLEANLDEVLERKKPNEISMRESFRRVLPPKMSKFVVPTSEVKQVLLNPVKFIENLEEEHKNSRKRVNVFGDEEESLDFLFKAILGNGSTEFRKNG